MNVIIAINVIYLWAMGAPNFFFVNGEAQRGLPKRQKKCHIEKKSPHKENRVAKGSYMEKRVPPLLRRKKVAKCPHIDFSVGGRSPTLTFSLRAPGML